MNLSFLPNKYFSLLLYMLCLAIWVSCDDDDTEIDEDLGFDLVVTSGDFLGGNNAALRFSGVDGSPEGEFAGTADGLNDPRDIVIDGTIGDPSATVLINSGNVPAGPMPDNDQTLRFSQSGEFIEIFSDFSETGSGFVDPGGAVFGPNGNFFIGSRAQGTVLEFSITDGSFVEASFPSDDVEFPRGFVFGLDGDLFVGNGADPNDPNEAGGGSILQIDGVTGAISIFVDNTTDSALSPLDVILNPDGTQLVVSSEFPFEGGANPNPGTVRIYDIATGELLNVLDPVDESGNSLIVAPRGMGFGPDGLLYVSSPGTESVLRFTQDGEFVDVFITFPGLNGQALNFVVD